MGKMGLGEAILTLWRSMRQASIFKKLFSQRGHTREEFVSDPFIGRERASIGIS